MANFLEDIIFICESESLSGSHWSFGVLCCIRLNNGCVDGDRASLNVEEFIKETLICLVDAKRRNEIDLAIEHDQTVDLWLRLVSAR